MTNKKEKFHQSTIFDQMRYNAQDIVDDAKREHEDEVASYNECDDHTRKCEYAEDVRCAQKKLDKARSHYAEIMDHIKEFEK